MSFDEIIRRAEALIQRDGLDAARTELGRARIAARDAEDHRLESAYTSVLASTFVIEGDHDQALAEYRVAEALDPQNISRTLAIADQLLRMRRHDEALAICRKVLASATADTSDRHVALITIGRAFIDSDPAEARIQLHAALAVAIEANLPTSLWDEMLAEDLARRGDDFGVKYLQTLRERAAAAGDKGTMIAMDDLLRALNVET